MSLIFNVHTCEGTSFKVFHHHPKLVLHQETIVHFNNVRMVIVSHNYHLTKHSRIFYLYIYFLSKCLKILKISTVLWWLWFTYLIEQQFSSLLLSQVHLLYGYLTPCGLIRRNANNSSRTFSNLYKVLQIISRVTRTDHHLKGRTKLDR